MSTFLPDLISSLFLWYRASSVTGVISGGPISAWPDDSGSGINLTVNTTNGPAPTYHTNVLNGFPSIRFSGGGYMTSTTHNQALEIAPSSLCIYIVYNNNDPYTSQVICANDYFAGSNQYRDFVLGLNYNDGQGYFGPSGWYYSWGHKTTLAGSTFETAEAYSSTFQKSFQPGNQFVLRADVFDPQFLATPSSVAPNGPGFYFDRYGANIAASSTVTNTVNTSSTFKVGWGDTTNGLSFNGDIVEICAFSSFPPYSGGNLLNTFSTQPYYGDTNLHKIMIDYLTQKYLIGAVNTCSLFMVGDTASGLYRDIPLYTTASPSSVTNAASLYEYGNTYASGTAPLYMHGLTKASGEFPLYIGSTTFISSGVPLYMYGKGNASNDMTLWLTTQTLAAISGTDFPLYINSLPNASSVKNTTLYISTTGVASHSNNFPLYINCPTNSVTGVPLPLYIGNYGPYNYQSVDFPLFIMGPPGGIASGTFSLYLSNNVSGSYPTGISLYTTSNYYLPSGSGEGSMPLFIERWPAAATSLYIHGKSLTSSGIPLYLSNSVSSGVPLYIYGSACASSVPPLILYTYSQAAPSATGTVPLFLNSATTLGTSGFYKDIPLYMSVVSSQANLPLYLQTAAIPLPEGFLPLFVSGPVTTGVIGGYASLFLQQSNQLFSNQTKLYTQGLGTLNGGFISQASMPLYIGRPQANLFPMFMYGKSSDTAGFPMVISGVFKGMNSIPLWIGTGTNSSSGLTGFIWGGSAANQGIPMTISGLPYQANVITLYERGF